MVPLVTLLALLPPEEAATAIMAITAAPPSSHQKVPSAMSAFCTPAALPGARGAGADEETSAANRLVANKDAARTVGKVMS